ncbi:MAG: hypothetical protein ACTH0M_00010 [Brevibacterium yomogidense]
MMGNTTMTVAAAKKKHTEAWRKVKHAGQAVDDAGAALDAAGREESRLDAELDAGGSIDAAGLASRIGENNAIVEALSRQYARRKAELSDAEAAVVVARRGVALAELQSLQQDLDAFDVDGERERLLGLVQDAYTDTLGRLYGLRERLDRARGWAETAQGAGVSVTVPPRFDTSVPVRLGGRGLVLPVQPSGVAEWFADLRDDERERAAEVGLAESRERDAEARRVQLEHQAAVSQSVRDGMSSKPMK